MKLTQNILMMQEWEKENSREYTEAGWPKSPYRGVSWNPGIMKWRSMVSKKGVHHKLGYFNYEDEAVAAQAYKDKMMELSLVPEDK